MHFTKTYMNFTIALSSDLYFFSTDTAHALASDFSLAEKSVLFLSV